MVVRSLAARTPTEGAGAATLWMLSRRAGQGILDRIEIR
jgi:hypothetical protein